jgi:hypothetical protein
MPAASWRGTFPMPSTWATSQPSRTRQPWTCSAVGSRVRTSAMQGREPGLQLELGQDSGSNTRASLLKSVPVGLSRKMSRPFALEDWDACFPISTRSAIWANGTVSPQAPLARLTKETDFGLLPTPTAAANQHHASMMKHPECRRLVDLPTPSAREGRDWSKASILARLDRGGCVARRVCSRTIPSEDQVVGLNPSFGEWMMGFPIGWTDLGASATPSSRKSRKSSSGRSTTPKP